MGAGCDSIWKLFMVARKSQKQESREEECQQVWMGGFLLLSREMQLSRSTPGLLGVHTLRCNGTFPGGYWLGLGTNVRWERECASKLLDQRGCSAKPLQLLLHRVVSLPLHHLLPGLLASSPCQVTREKRTENSMFGSGVSIILLGVEAFPREPAELAAHSISDMKISNSSYYYHRLTTIY